MESYFLALWSVSTLYNVGWDAATRIWLGVKYLCLQRNTLTLKSSQQSSHLQGHNAKSTAH